MLVHYPHPWRRYFWPAGIWPLIFSHFGRVKSCGEPPAVEVPTRWRASGRAASDNDAGGRRQPGVLHLPHGSGLRVALANKRETAAQVGRCGCPCTGPAGVPGVGWCRMDVSRDVRHLPLWMIFEIRFL
jgi:hypothetical protein